MSKGFDEVGKRHEPRWGIHQAAAQSSMTNELSGSVLLLPGHRLMAGWGYPGGVMGHGSTI